jgi:hypothetical protein
VPKAAKREKSPYKVGDMVTVSGWQPYDKSFKARVTEVSLLTQQVLVHPEGRNFEVWVSEHRVSK